MKGLAEFVMRGRPQALFVAVAAAGSLLLCWISAAVVALVTLRKGAGQGAWLVAWALLPAGAVWYAFGDLGPLTLLLGTLALALVLRATVSLPLAVLTSVAVGVVCGLLMMAVGAEHLQQLVAWFDDFLAQLEQSLSQGGGQVVLPRPEAVQVAGMLGSGTAATSVLCLLLARYWQAALYNPGGFGAEFRALRYPVGVTLGLVVAALAVASMGFQLRSWMMIFFIPLTFAGLALVHARAKSRGQGAGWLGVFYAAWVIFDPVKLLVVFFAIADSWLDFRRRWAERDQRGGPGPGPEKKDLPGKNDSPEKKDDEL